MFSVSDWCARATLIAGGVTHGWVVLGALGKQAGQANKKHSSIALLQSRLQVSALTSCLGFPQWTVTCDTYVSQINPVLPELLLVMLFYHSNRNPKPE